MIEKLYNTGCFDYKKFIFDNSKMLSINPDQILVLIYLLDNYQSTNKIFTDKISESLPLSKSKIDNALSALLDRDFYEISVDYNEGIGEEIYSLNPFFEKCETLLDHDKKDDKDELAKINTYLSKAMNRILSASEMEIITSLVKEDRYSYLDIKAACDKIVEKKKALNMKSLTYELSNAEKKEEPKTTKAPQVLKDFMASIK